MRISDYEKIYTLSPDDILLVDTDVGTKTIRFDDVIKNLFEDEPNVKSVKGLTNKNITIAMNKANDRTEILEQIANGTYEGRNLADVFDNEIAKYSSPWEWIQSRVDMRSFRGMFPADYIPITMSDGEVVIPQIAGIDTYYKTMDYVVPYHIDFISKDCLIQKAQWNTTNINNGTSSNTVPYSVSNIKTHLNTTVYNKLPDDVKSAIVEKENLLEIRYNENGVLVDSNGIDFVYMGKLWLPTEYEIFGSIAYGTKGISGGQCVRYPLFSNKNEYIVKRSGNNGSRSNWWLGTVYSGNGVDSCIVSYTGYPHHRSTSESNGVPVCFRIAKQS